MINNNKRLVFFDVDGTLINKVPAIELAKFLYKKRILTLGDLTSGVYYHALHKLNFLNFDSIVENYLKSINGTYRKKVEEWCDDIFLRKLRFCFIPSILAKLHQHHRNGDIIILMTAGIMPLTEKLANSLPIDEIVSTDVVVKNGKLTNQIIKPLPYSDGKLFWAKKIEKKYSLPINNSVFYTDSISDRPLLERVGEKVIVNPGWMLKRLAKNKGWEIIKDHTTCDVMKFNQLNIGTL